MDFINLIFLSSTWNLNHRKRLHTALNNILSSWSDVVFVEAPFSILYHTFFKFSSRVIPLIRNKNSSQEIETIKPVVLFHSKVWKIIPFTLGIDSFLISLQLKKFIKKNYLNKKVIAWANSPYDYSNIKLLNTTKIIYDFYDNFSFDNDGKRNELSDSLNTELIKNSDLIFCTGKIMFNYAIQLNKNTYYLPNGHSLDTFSKVDTADLGIKGKIIGYIGNIRDWIDFDLITQLVNSLKENQFVVFIGPVEKNVLDRINKLKENKKFCHIPAVSYSKIFNFIKAFDMGIIPFKINKFTEGVLPYKFFEYIAGDVTIVSTALPDMVMYKDVVNVAENNQEFVRMCTDDSIRLNKDFKEYENIKNESRWENRAEFIENKIKELITE